MKSLWIEMKLECDCGNIMLAAQPWEPNEHRFICKVCGRVYGVTVRVAESKESTP